MRYCKHCGSLLEDDAQVCGFCGVTLEIVKSEPDIQEQTADIPVPAPKKKFPKKTVFIGSGILLGIIVLAIAAYFLFFGYYHAIVKYESVMTGNYKQVQTLAPQEYWEKMAQESNLTTKEYLEKQAKALKRLEENNKERRQELFGDNYSASIEVVDSEEINQDTLTRIKTALKDTYDIAPSRVKAGQKLILKVVCSGTKDTDTRACIVVAIQLDTQWYLIKYSPSETDLTVSFLASGTLSSLQNIVGIIEYE